MIVAYFAEFSTQNVHRAHPGFVNGLDVDILRELDIAVPQNRLNLFVVHKYGLQGRYGSYEGQPPLADRVEKKIAEKMEAGELTDPTSIMVWRRKWTKNEERGSRPIKFGRRGINRRRRMTF